MEEMVDYALGLCGDAQYAEAFLEEKEEDAFFLKNGNPELGGFSTQKGMSVRLLVNGSLGFAATNRLDRPHIKDMIRKALKIARSGSRLVTDPAIFSQEKAHTARVGVRMKKDPRDFSPREKLDIMYQIDSALLDTPKLSVPVRHMYFDHELLNSVYANTEGTKISSAIPRLYFFWFLTVKRGSDARQKYFQYNSTTGMEALKEWNIPEHITRTAQTLAENMLNGKKVRPGTYDIICGPEITGIAAHESVGHPYEADRILGRESAQAGESFVSPDMVGRQIGSEIVSVIDKPNIPGTAGFYRYDREGVKARKRYLMKNGRIHSFLHNRATAANMGLKSNGSARADGFDREPIVRMANTYVEPGDWEEDEIFAETKNGIFINSFKEWNIDDTRYNQKYVGSEAYYVKNGRILHPVVAPVLELSTPKFWSSVDAVASNFELRAAICGKGEPTQGVPVTNGGPTIRLSRIKIR